jgi:hypothetical protein
MMFDTDADLIETTDEEGNVHIFEMVKDFEFEGNRYAILVYHGGPEEEETADEEGYDEKAVVMRVGHEDGADTFEQIDDEAELDRVIDFIESMPDEELAES